MSGSLAARVKSRREELGLSQRGLPGIDQGLLSRIESGKTKDPGLEVLRNLGKALKLSLDELDGAPASAVRMVELKHLAVDHDNPRKIRPDSAEDQSLVESIRTLGLLQPLAVRDVSEPLTLEPVWMVVDGHRRYAALAAIHGPKSKTLVPCRIVKADDSQKLLMQLVANVQRADMNPLDLAKAVGQLIDGGMGTQMIGDAIGRKRRWVQEQASIARQFHPEAAVALQSGQISISQAVAIAARKEDPEQQRVTLERVVEQGLNEDDIRAITADRKAKATAEEESKQLDIEEVTGSPKGQGPLVAKRWKHRRGYLNISVHAFGDHRFVGVYDYKWRAGGGGSARADKHGQAEKTCAIAFLAACRAPFKFICATAKDNAEDVPVAIELWQWVNDRLAELGATERVLRDWRLNNRPPAKPKAKREAAKKAAPVAAPEPVLDAAKPPLWATPMTDALFCVHSGRMAWLCHGWHQMALAFVRMAGGPGDGLAELYRRDLWQDDIEGKPFDFGSSVIRLIGAPS